MLKKSQVDWDLFWLRLARAYSTGSKDPSTKCGAVIVQGNRLRSAGFNSFPADIEDLPQHYLDRDVKMERIKHAEIAALDDFKMRENSKGTMYVWPFAPCGDCANSVVQSGVISTIVTTDYVPERWRESFQTSEHILLSNRIDLRRYAIAAV